MFTVEFEHDSTVVRTLDEEGNLEDVEMVLDEDIVYIRQWDDDLGKYEMVILSFQQLLDLAASLQTTEGLHKIETVKDG